MENITLNMENKTQNNSFPECQSCHYYLDLEVVIVVIGMMLLLALCFGVAH